MIALSNAIIPVAIVLCKWWLPYMLCSSASAFRMASNSSTALRCSMLCSSPGAFRMASNSSTAVRCSMLCSSACVRLAVQSMRWVQSVRGIAVYDSCLLCSMPCAPRELSIMSYARASSVSLNSLSLLCKSHPLGNVAPAGSNEISLISCPA